MKTKDALRGDAPLFIAVQNLIIVSLVRSRRRIVLAIAEILFLFHRTCRRERSLFPRFCVPVRFAEFVRTATFDCMLERGNGFGYLPVFSFPCDECNVVIPRMHVLLMSGGEAAVVGRSTARRDGRSSRRSSTDSHLLSSSTAKHLED